VIDEIAMQLALRDWAKTLVVATTGVLALAATASGYTRTTGSFVDDGFWPGMEITPAGFIANAPRVITDVSALVITVSGASRQKPSPVAARSQWACHRVARGRTRRFSRRRACRGCARSFSRPDRAGHARAAG
jgi:hypothetical protein